MVQADWIIVFLYFVLVSIYGYWIYQRKKLAEASSADFFLAEGSLTWWAIGRTYPDYCGGVLYAGVFKEQDFYHAAIFA
jgi:Na+/proline symporter